VQCVGAHGAHVPLDLRKVIKRATHSEKALRLLEKELFKNPIYKSFVGTTQAIDLIRGGVKVNALPESAWAVINHRISVIRSAIAFLSFCSPILIF
jgi:Gly-Xaa carboxypeptidase